MVGVLSLLIDFLFRISTRMSTVPAVSTVVTAIVGVPAVPAPLTVPVGPHLIWFPCETALLQVNGGDAVVD